jgi:hypothetical protein
MRRRTCFETPRCSWSSLLSTADYKIDIELDDKNAKLNGSETVTYYNNSPDNLDYLWVQLDQNQQAKDSESPLAESERITQTFPASFLLINF